MQGNKLACGILFAVLLNFKHIYMYLAVCLPQSRNEMVFVDVSL